MRQNSSYHDTGCYGCLRKTFLGLDMQFLMLLDLKIGLS